MVKLCEFASQSLKVTLIWEAEGSTPDCQIGAVASGGYQLARAAP